MFKDILNARDVSRHWETRRLHQLRVWLEVGTLKWPNLELRVGTEFCCFDSRISIINSRFGTAPPTLSGLQLR